MLAFLCPDRQEQDRNEGKTDASFSSNSECSNKKLSKINQQSAAYSWKVIQELNENNRKYFWILSRKTIESIKIYRMD